MNQQRSAHNQGRTPATLVKCPIEGKDVLMGRQCTPGQTKVEVLMKRCGKPWSTQLHHLWDDTQNVPEILWTTTLLLWHAWETYSGDGTQFCPFASCWPMRSSSRVWTAHTVPLLMGLLLLSPLSHMLYELSPSTQPLVNSLIWVNSLNTEFVNTVQHDWATLPAQAHLGRMRSMDRCASGFGGHFLSLLLFLFFPILWHTPLNTEYLMWVKYLD